MPISAPPPSWASIKNKPKTVSEFGITDMSSQSVASATNATNVTNVTAAQVGNAFALISYGAIGSMTVAKQNGDGLMTFGTTYAASSLYRFNENNGVFEGAGLSGTWRSLGSAEGFRYTNSSNALRGHLMVRIS